MSTVRKHFWHDVSRWLGGFSSPRKYGLNGCIPAVVSSTEGSYDDGTSDADGTRRWPRSSKNDKYFSRISSARTRPSLRRRQTQAWRPASAASFGRYFRLIELRSQAAFALFRTGTTLVARTRYGLSHIHGIAAAVAMTFLS